MSTTRSDNFITLAPIPLDAKVLVTSLSSWQTSIPMNARYKWMIFTTKDTGKLYHIIDDGKTQVEELTFGTGSVDAQSWKTTATLTATLGQISNNIARTTVSTYLPGKTTADLKPGDLVVDNTGVVGYVTETTTTNFKVITVAFTTTRTLIPEFATTTVYKQNQAVSYGGYIYKANADFTSTSSFVPSNWTVLSKDKMIIDDFEANKSYSASEVIIHDGKLYQAKQNFTPTSFNPTQWNEITQNEAILPNFQASYSYKQYEAIVQGGFVYRAKNAFLSGASFNEADWEVLSKDKTVAHDFASNTYYLKDELIVNGGTFYRAEGNFTSQSTFDPNDWEAITNTDVLIKDFAPSTSYEKDEVVVYQGLLYRANTNFTSGADFDPTYWDALNKSASVAPEFVPNANYVKDELVTNNNYLYKADHNFLAGASFDPDDWIILSKDLPIIPDFVPNVYYEDDQVAVYQGVLYRTNQSFTAGADFDPTKWDLITGEDLSYAPNFAANTLYKQYQIIAHEGYLYRAVSQFTSDSDFDPDNWEVLSKDRSVALDFIANHHYLASELAVNSGSLYRALTEFDSDADFDPNEWQMLSGSGSLDIIPDFSPNTLYKQYQPIAHEGYLYRAKGQFTSTSDFVAIDWEILSKDITIAPDFAVNQTYKANELIVEGGILYRAKADTPARASFDPDDWQAIGSDSITIKDFNAASTYSEDEVVVYGGATYRAKADITTPGAFDPDDWQKIGEVRSYAHDFVAGAYYEEDEIIAYEGYLYRAISNFTATSSFDLANWEIISKDETYAPNFSAASTYKQYQLIANDGLLYRAKADITTPGAFDPDDWEQVGGEIVSLIPPFANDTYYKQYQAVSFNGYVYQARNNFTSGNSFDESKWNVLSKDKMIIENFQPSHLYKLGEIIVHDGVLWQAKYDFESGATFSDTDWIKLDKEGASFLIYEDDFGFTQIGQQVNNLSTADLQSGTPKIGDLVSDEKGTILLVNDVLTNTFSGEVVASDISQIYGFATSNTLLTSIGSLNDDIPFANITPRTPSGPVAKIKIGDLISDSKGTLAYVTSVDTGASTVDCITIVSSADGKVDKTSTANQLYGTDESGDQTTYTVAESNTASTVPIRDADGQVKVALTPTDEEDAASKQYVDTVSTRAVHYIDSVSSWIYGDSTLDSTHADITTQINALFATGLYATGGPFKIFVANYTDDGEYKIARYLLNNDGTFALDKMYANQLTNADVVFIKEAPFQVIRTASSTVETFKGQTIWNEDDSLWDFIPDSTGDPDEEDITYNADGELTFDKDAILTDGGNKNVLNRTDADVIAYDLNAVNKQTVKQVLDILLKNAFVGDYADNTKYYKDQIVLHQSKMYRAKATFTPTTFDPTEWDEIAGEGGSTFLRYSEVLDSNILTDGLSDLPFANLDKTPKVGDFVLDTGGNILEVTTVNTVASTFDGVLVSSSQTYVFDSDTVLTLGVGNYTNSIPFTNLHNYQTTNSNEVKNTDLLVDGAGTIAVVTSVDYTAQTVNARTMTAPTQSEAINLTAQMNGSTQTFSLGKVIAGGLASNQLFYGGIFLTYGSDYTITGSDLTTTLDVPPTSDNGRTLILYHGLSGSAGQVDPVDLISQDADNAITLGTDSKLFASVSILQTADIQSVGLYPDAASALAASEADSTKLCFYPED